jgi:hypothetical protein
MISIRTTPDEYLQIYIDQMLQKLQPTVRNYNTVVLHIGANDLCRGLPIKTVLNKYQQLTSAIWDINPTADIILSGLLPRASNQFPGALPRTDFLQDLNQRAHLLNNCLASLASRRFWLRHLSSWRGWKIPHAVTWFGSV